MRRNAPPITLETSNRSQIDQKVHKERLSTNICLTVSNLTKQRPVSLPNKPNIVLSVYESYSVVRVVRSVQYVNYCEHFFVTIFPYFHFSQPHFDLTLCFECKKHLTFDNYDVQLVVNLHFLYYTLPCVLSNISCVYI